MTWVYKQSTGELAHNGLYVGTGYSGHPPHVNDPSAQNIPNFGPIPVGEYTLGPPFTHPICGPMAMRLSPEPQNEMFSRSGFLCHGDSIHAPGTASDGCIIMSRPIRQQMADSDDNDLTVIA